MKPELSIVVAFLKHSVWKEYRGHLQAKDFPEDLQLLYRTLNSFHEGHEEDLHLYDLANLFFANKPANKEFYEELFSTLQGYEPNMSTVLSLIQSLKRARLLRELSIGAYEVAEGKKVYQTLEPLLAGLNEQLEQQTTEQEEYVTTDLEQLVSEAVKTPGLRWRLKTLNRMLGSLRKGDFGFVFARPETGKTTFLASEISHMLTQTEGDVLWFNNEEQGSKVMLRVYQAFFGAPIEELYSNTKKFKDLFQEQTQDRFKLIDSASIDWRKVERVCKQTSPTLILFDQIDKIKGFEADREDLHLGAIYQWAREISKEFAPTIGVCQADGSGENQKWLSMANVANAKTAKQAEADWILGIGKIHDTGWENIRFFHLSKNKLIGDIDTDPALRHGKEVVLIEPAIARYLDMEKQ